MKTLMLKKYLTLGLLLAAFCAPSHAQTARTVMVNSSNSVILYPTNFWAPNAVAARSGLGLGSAATNSASAFQPSSTVLSNLAVSNAVGLTNVSASAIVGAVAVANGGTGGTNVATARTGLGATTVGANLFTLTNPSAIRFLRINSDNSASALTDSDFRTAIGLGTAATNTASAFQPSSINLSNLANNNGSGLTNITAANITGTVAIANGGSGATTAGGARTNLGLPWTGLTNVDSATFQTALFGSGTNPVLVNTGGSVISPTNFWQAAPISTLVQYSQPVANATNTATNARNLYLYSLAPSTVNITNTIQLPTNGSTFLGDVVFVIHEGATSSVTAIRQIGASTNIITLNEFQEAVKLIFEADGWHLADNVSQVEPIYFSGTNAADNIAASRTNLGLGATWLTNTNVTNFRTDIGLGVTNNVLFSNVVVSGTLTATSTITARTNLVVDGFLTYSTNSTNSNPLTDNQVNDFIEIRVGTNQFWLPVYK